MIGVFDSGFGGLTILKELLNKLPEYDYMYLGDNIRAPYGHKSQETIYNYTKDAVDFLFSKGCELIILACGTASSQALRKIQQEYLPEKYPNKRVLGIVIPLSEESLKLNKNYKIGVIGTKATIKSNVYEKEIKKLNKEKKIEIIEKACPLLVPLIEEGWIDTRETKMILKKYLRPLKVKNIDTLILGCTHYPFLIKDIKRIMGNKVNVIDTPKIVSEKLKEYLERHIEIEKKLKKNKKRVYYTTDDSKKFEEFAKKFLKEKIEVIKTEL